MVDASKQVDVHCWGDRHGFAILNQLRAWLPRTRSFLMDRQTLVEQRDRWGREPAPTAARLDRLTPDAVALYADLVSDRMGEAVRLEQERLDWSPERLHAGARYRAAAMSVCAKS